MRLSADNLDLSDEAIALSQPSSVPSSHNSHRGQNDSDTEVTAERRVAEDERMPEGGEDRNQETPFMLNAEDKASDRIKVHVEDMNNAAQLSHVDEEHELANSTSVSSSPGWASLPEVCEEQREKWLRQPLTPKPYNSFGGKGELSQVTHVNYVNKGTILVTDMLEGRILHTDSSGRTLACFQTELAMEPWCACVTPRGHVAITLRRPACVTIWTAKGALVCEFSHQDFSCPTGLACDQQGRFLVTDERANRVGVFSPTGSFLQYLVHQKPQTDGSSKQQGSQHSQQSKEGGQTTQSLPDNTFSECLRADESEGDSTPAKQMVGFSLGGAHEHTAEDSHNLRDEAGPAKDNSNTLVYILSSRNSARSTPSAEVPAELHSDHDPYEFNLPRYVCVSVSGKILVSDSGSHSIKVFTSEGIYSHSIGSYGSGDEQLKVPYGVCCDQDENVYVADHYNDRVSMFAIGGPFLRHVLTAECGLWRPKSVAVCLTHDRKLYVSHGGLHATKVLVYRLVTSGHRVTFTFDM